LVGAQSEQSLREFALRTVGDDRDRSLSPDTRTKMIDGLIKVLEDEKQPADVKAQAMRSLGTLAGSSTEADRVEQALLLAAEKAEDDSTKLAAAAGLNKLGSPQGVEQMWLVLQNSNDEQTQASVVEFLGHENAVPPTAEAAKVLARLAVRGMPGTVPRTGGDGSDPWNALQLLQNANNNSQGIRRLIEAIETTKDSAAMSSEPNESADDMSMMGSTNGERTILLNVLATAKPTTDEIAAALVEALSHKDAGIREAAARALGNAEPAARRGGSRGPMGGPMGSSRGGMRSPTGMRARGSDSFGAGYEATANPLQAADAANPFGPVQTPPEQPQVSPAVRKELIKSLTAAGTDEKATPRSRYTSLSTLAKLTKGTEEANATAEIVDGRLEKATDEEERRTLRLLLHILGHQRASTTLWPMLPEPDYAVEFERRQFDMLSELNAVGAVPQTPQETVKLAFAIAALRLDQHRNREQFESERERILAYAPLQAATNILDRMTTSGEGVRRIVEAYALADKPAPETPSSEAFGPKEYGYVHNTPVRHVLLGAIVFVKPTSDEIATALAEALSNEDGAVRAAAAAALENLNGSK
ncbi:MAG: hypothetical protein WBC44_10000, partial [Planctomycetaceae bacterium]